MLLLDDGDLPQQYIVSYPEIIISLMLSFESSSMFEMLRSGYAIFILILVILYVLNNLNIFVEMYISTKTIKKVLGTNESM